MVVERKQCTFLSHDPPVLLAQLEEEYPGIYPLIPFYLGWKSGIMKELTVGSMCHTIERTDRQGYPNC
jgi:hypothetical protein